MKGQNVFINNDFSKATLELRKELMVEIKRLGELGKIALFKLYHSSFQGKGRGVNVKINIKNKYSWVNKNAVRIRFRMFIIRSVFLARKLYEQRKCDPDISFYQNNVSNVEANYFLMTEVESSLASFDPNTFSALHLNVRSM